MKLRDFGAIVCVGWWATLGCAGAAGSAEAGSSDEADAVKGESSSALHVEASKTCPPKKPLGEHCKDCKRTKIGAPLWEPTGVAVIAAPVGSTSVDAFLTFLDGMMEPTHALDANDFIIGPGVPHAGPYNDELPTLAQAKGIELKQSFHAQEFTGTGGIAILVNFVPSAGAPTGSSVDFDAGPIIPNSVFPISEDGDLFRDGVMYDPFFDGSWSGYPGMNPPILKDGPSHFPWFFGENAAFGPPNTPVTGKYLFKLKITDNTGAGWNLEVPFTVKK